jgi:hypothetical protein
VIAGVGHPVSVLRFARRLDGLDIDAAAARAWELWLEVRADLPADAQAAPFKAMIAGWAADGLPLLAVLQHPAGGLIEDCGAFCAGPAGSVEVTDAYVGRFEDPAACDAFDAERDGLAFLESLRRQFPRVGGFVQRTTITRDGIETRIIRHWCDVVGRLIEPGAEANLDEASDPNWPDQTLAQVQAVRDGFVGRNIRLAEAA